MRNDPIVEEIRKIRHEYAAQFNNDTAAMLADLQRFERESGLVFIQPPPKEMNPAANSPDDAKPAADADAA